MIYGVFLNNYVAEAGFPAYEIKGDTEYTAVRTLFVLRNQKTPAALLELGNINKETAKDLWKNEKMLDAIVEGINKYIDERKKE